MYWHSLVTLCPAVMWKAELVSDEPGYLLEGITKEKC